MKERVGGGGVGGVQFRNLNIYLPLNGIAIITEQFQEGPF